MVDSTVPGVLQKKLEGTGRAVCDIQTHHFDIYGHNLQFSGYYPQERDLYIEF
jgi:hypothetical protein